MIEILFALAVVAVVAIGGSLIDPAPCIRCGEPSDSYTYPHCPSCAEAVDAEV